MFVANLMENRRFHQRLRQVDDIRLASVEPHISHTTKPILLKKNLFAPLQWTNQLQPPEAVALCCDNLRNFVLVRFQPGRQQPDREDRPCQPF